METNEILGTITIPGNPLLLKNGKWTSCKPGRNNRHHCGFVPYIISGLKVYDAKAGKKKTCTEKDKSNLAMMIRAQWTKDTITDRYVNIKMTFFLPSYRFTKVPDQSNLYQIWEDFFQKTVIKNGKITRYGGGVFEDDVLVGGHDGSRRRFLCNTCEWGKTGTRKKNLQSARRGLVRRCPGTKICQFSKTVIEVSFLIDS